jgi:hypothetical protein
MDAVTAGHEDRQPPAGDPAWIEGHRVDGWADHGRLGLTWAVTAQPSEGRAGFAAAVLRPGEPAIVLVDDDIDLPARRWELRTSGLWADHVCETPLDHWSYGLEAFALVVDDPAELLGRAVGDRIPLGWELEFEAGGTAVPEGPDAYRQDGVVHGLLLIGSTTTEVELAAVRRHWWGTEPPRALEGQPAPDAVALPSADRCWWVAPGPGGLTVCHTPRPSPG